MQSSNSLQKQKLFFMLLLFLYNLMDGCTTPLKRVLVKPEQAHTHTNTQASCYCSVITLPISKKK